MELKYKSHRYIVDYPEKTEPERNEAGQIEFYFPAFANLGNYLLECMKETLNISSAWLENIMLFF